MRRGAFKTHGVRSCGLCLEEGRHLDAIGSVSHGYIRGAGRGRCGNSESKNEIEEKDLYGSGVAGTEKRDFG